MGLGDDVNTRHAPELNIMRDLILRVWKAELKEQRKIIIIDFILVLAAYGSGLQFH